MLMVIGIDVILALALAFWLRAMLRARAGAIPCTARVVSPWVILVGLVGLVGCVIANALTLLALHELGKDLAVPPFVIWLGVMSADSILFIVAITTWWVNREALVWIRMVSPATLVVREPAGETTLTLTPSSVRAFVVGNGVSGPAYVQYFIEAGERTLNLVVPFTVAASASINKAPWLGSYTGPIAQGGARPLNRFLAPFCQKHTPPAA